MTKNKTMNWYLSQGEQAKSDRYTELFMKALRRYNVSWCDATPQQRCFIEEVVRIEWEREIALSTGTPLDTIRPAFSA